MSRYARHPISGSIMPIAGSGSGGGLNPIIIAPVETTSTATRAYAVGDQFVYNNLLYTATSAISVGATITPGTNCSISDTITEQIGNAGKVTGVKGNDESTYRTGDVNISPADIGLGDVDNTSDADKPVSSATQAALNGKVSTDGASTNTTVVFTSNDLAANTTAKTSDTTNQPSTVAKLGSGETLASMFGKISSMFASIRKLWNTVGTSKLSTKLGTTVTGTVNTLNTNLVATYNSSDVPFKFGIDADGNYGYIKAGADSVTPFKSGGNKATDFYKTSGSVSTNTNITVNYSSQSAGRKPKVILLAKRYYYNNSAEAQCYDYERMQYFYSYSQGTVVQLSELTEEPSTSTFTFGSGSAQGCQWAIGVYF